MMKKVTSCLTWMKELGLMWWALMAQSTPFQCTIDLQFEENDSKIINRAQNYSHFIFKKSNNERQNSSGLHRERNQGRLIRPWSLAQRKVLWGHQLQIGPVRFTKNRPKEAARILKKRVSSRNPKVQLLALELIDTALGKCGLPFQNSVATPQFMQTLINVLNTREVGH